MAEMTALGMSNVSIFGEILSAIGSVYSGYLSNDVAKHNAKVAEAQARLIEAEQRGNEALSAAGKKVRHIVAGKQMRAFEGTQAAAYASSGVRMTGSPIDVIVNSRANLELDLALTDINESIANTSMASQSRLAASGYRSEGMLYKAQGKSALAQGYMGAAKSLLNAATEKYSQGKTIGSKTEIIGGKGGRTIQTKQYGKVWSPY